MTRKNLTQEELEHLLPIELRLRLGLRPGSREAFFRAYTEGFIAVREDGLLRWTPENVTMLAYFCGRLWCGDSPLYIRLRETYIWNTGKRKLPAKAIEQLFGVKNLSVLRCQNKKSQLGEFLLSIDTLFDTDAG